MQTITAFLWFNNQAEEAANFYVSLFPNSKITTIVRYNAESAAASHQPEGSVMTIAFELNGNKFAALNGGPIFKFSEAISFVIGCKTQEEIDHYWNALAANGGQESQCGWCKDKFGVSWQVVPANMGDLVGNPDPEKAKRAMTAMLGMKKLDREVLRNA